MQEIEQLISDLHYHGWEGSKRMDVIESIFVKAAKNLIQEGGEYQIDKAILIEMIEKVS